MNSILLFLMQSNHEQSNIDFLKELDATHLKGQADSILKQLIVRGFIPLKIPTQIEIEGQVKSYMEANGGKKRKAVKSVSEKLDIDLWTVWDALRQMKKMVKTNSRK